MTLAKNLKSCVLGCTLCVERSNLTCINNWLSLQNNELSRVLKSIWLYELMRKKGVQVRLYTFFPNKHCI